MTRIYLAHPLDQVHGRLRPEQVADVASVLAGAGHWVYDPGAAFHTGAIKSGSDWTHQVNSTALNSSDAVLAILLAGIPTLGTVAEVERGLRLGKPVAVMTDMEGRSVQIEEWSARGATILHWDAARDGLQHWARQADPRTWISQVRKAVQPVGLSNLMVTAQEQEAVTIVNGAGAVQEVVEGPARPAPAQGRLCGHDSLSTRGCTQRTNRVLPVLAEAPAFLPRRVYDDDAGLDLIVSESRWIEPGEFIDVPCGVSVELPSDVWALIIGRSSTLRKRHLMVAQGVIDPGYRGPLFTGVWNLGSDGHQVDEGERIGQLIILPNTTPLFEPTAVRTLSESRRGQAGFGSTGE